MPGFTKLFSSIVDSTIWREDPCTKVVWVTMLAKADKIGYVCSSLPGLADAARVSLEECKHALALFLAPDEYSRTKDFEGRRIMEVDGGWVLLNYLKYRKTQDEDEVRIATAERVRKHRAKFAQDKGGDGVTDVTLGNTLGQGVTPVTPGNAIAEAEGEANNSTPLPPPGERSKEKGKRRLREVKPKEPSLEELLDGKGKSKTGNVTGGLLPVGQREPTYSSQSSSCLD